MLSLQNENPDKTIRIFCLFFILNLYDTLFQGYTPVLHNNNNFAAGSYKIDFILL